MSEVISLSGFEADARLDTIRLQIRQAILADEATTMRQLIADAGLDQAERDAISRQAADLVRRVRSETKPSMMEVFLAEYGLDTKEGIALMCMAEALLRVPDAETIDELIEDKIVPGNWGGHLGQSGSSLVNASSWALLLTGKLIKEDEKLPGADKDGVLDTVRGVVKRLGEPMVRVAVAQVMKELGRQFVRGRTIEEAMKKARKEEAQGYTYTYDMLGESARTDADAKRYHLSYSDAITALAPACRHTDIRDNPSISIKMSALHPRYEFGQKERVMVELVSRVRSLALLAKSANMGFNIDAEEADRLDLSLDVIEAVLSDPALVGWDGFGVVVQAYGPRCAHKIDWLYALAQKLDRNIMIRLVKGAYWDAEIKLAQTHGVDGFPVFTRKANSDVAYISCAKKLLSMTDRIYPQFATHNAHSVAAIMHIAGDSKAYEFQRLHGMGESLHDVVVMGKKARSRIYAPVGAHQDLLAYLVRRLLENGSNSSFVNQLVDESIAPEQIARDPFALVESFGDNIANQNIPRPADIYGGKRRNAKGWDITDPLEVAEIEQGRERYHSCQWQAGPLIAGEVQGSEVVIKTNPALPEDVVGQVTQAVAADVDTALSSAEQAVSEWSALPVSERAARIRRVGELFEAHSDELFALATREAGKTLLDAVGEIREAVDFAFYYACEAERLSEENRAGEARGVISCISPWNFPLAIFAGQVLASLAAGNTVIAKPAGQTAIIAYRAVQLMHEAGIPEAAVQLLPGRGSEIGTPLTADPRIRGVVFTGSTDTAQRINRVMAQTVAPDAPLIAETGGLNAMIVDSTALPEQVVRDVLASAFQSAGQRCSALRMLYVQKDVAEHVLQMLFRAMDELAVGNPWLLSTDVGPVIDEGARAGIVAHCEKFKAHGRVLKQVNVPSEGLFVAPTVIKLDGIEQLEEEIFGPVLHVATFEAGELEQVVDAINDKGFGLTFGLHTRVDNRVERVVNRIKVGNVYVNRNQIGAIVGSQPFGGEGLSGTGPKAGGPHYVRRMMSTEAVTHSRVEGCKTADQNQVRMALQQLTMASWAMADDRMTRLQQAFPALDIPAVSREPQEMPGPTGETNLLSHHPRGVVLCLGNECQTALEQAACALVQGNGAVVVAPGASDAIREAERAGIPVIGIDGVLSPEALMTLNGFDAVAAMAEVEILQAYRKALAARDGMLIPLITERNAPERFVLERHLCIDTTAAGGNASLIAAAGE